MAKKLPSQIDALLARDTPVRFTAREANERAQVVLAVLAALPIEDAQALHEEMRRSRTYEGRAVAKRVELVMKKRAKKRAKS